MASASALAERKRVTDEGTLFSRPLIRLRHLLPRAAGEKGNNTLAPVFRAPPTEHGRGNRLVRSATRATTCFFAVIPSVSEESGGEEGAPPDSSLPLGMTTRCQSKRYAVCRARRGRQEEQPRCLVSRADRALRTPRAKRAARSDMFFRCNSERERGIWRRGVRAAAPPDPSLPLGMTASRQSKR